MSKRTLLIVLLILILIGVITATGLYIGKKLAQPQEEPSAYPSTEPEEIAPEITPTEPREIDTSNWKVYRSERYGFEMKYPPHLDIQKKLLDQPFNPGLEGSIIDIFSDGLTDELGVAVFHGSLDGFIVRDNPGGVFYRFDEKENRWISSVRDEITGTEPKLLDVSVTSYGYRSGDGICRWHETVIPHSGKNYVFELIFTSCVDEGQQPGPLGRIPDVAKIVSTFRFLNK